jgi:large subunit ribosomal protein L9
MDIILKKDTPNLGDAGEIVKVKAGYARNFLIPQGWAMTATTSNVKVIKENQKQAAHKLAKARIEAEAKADTLRKLDLKFPVKVGTTGKIFGSITTLQISRLLKELGYEVDRKDITFSEDVNKIGTYSINVKIYKDVIAEVKLDVVREDELETAE